MDLTMFCVILFVGWYAETSFYVSTMLRYHGEEARKMRSRILRGFEFKALTKYIHDGYIPYIFIMLRGVAL